MKNPKVYIRLIFNALRSRPQSSSQTPLEEQGRFRLFGADRYGSQFRSLKHVPEEWSKRESWNLNRHSIEIVSYFLY